MVQGAGDLCRTVVIAFSVYLVGRSEDRIRVVKKTSCGCFTNQQVEPVNHSDGRGSLYHLSSKMMILVLHLFRSDCTVCTLVPEALRNTEKEREKGEEALLSSLLSLPLFLRAS